VTPDTCPNCGAARPDFGATPKGGWICAGCLHYATPQDVAGDDFDARIAPQLRERGVNDERLVIVRDSYIASELAVSRG
jgi:hypothetical protein